MTKSSLINRIRRDEAGQGVVMLAAVTVVLAVAVFLLLRTAVLANDIDEKAENIAKTGRGINTATDAILQLTQTNELGKSILETSVPLVPTLDKVVAVAQSIDGLAGSINNTAVDVNGTAKGINSTASRIQNTATSINNGVEAINRNVDTLTGIAQQVKADTGGIVTQANTAHRLGSCIDSGLNILGVLSTSTPDGHCQ